MRSAWASLSMALVMSALAIKLWWLVLEYARLRAFAIALDIDPRQATTPKGLVLNAIVVTLAAALYWARTIWRAGKEDQRA